MKYSNYVNSALALGLPDSSDEPVVSSPALWVSLFQSLPSAVRQSAFNLQPSACPNMSARREQQLLRNNNDNRCAERRKLRHSLWKIVCLRRPYTSFPIILVQQVLFTQQANPQSIKYLRCHTIAVITSLWSTLHGQAPMSR